MDKLEVKAQLAVDDAGTITGIAWPAGSTDIEGDRIKAGAFNFPTALPIMFEHNQGQVVGVWESATETDAGLEVKGRLFVEGVGPAQQVRQMLRTGIVKGLSIGFRDGVSTPLASGGREFDSLTVTEISLCRQPKNRGARVTAVKAQPRQETPMDPEETTEETAAPAVELKAVNDNFVKLTARLDKMEAKLNRPAPANDNASAPDTERKAFATYLRLGTAAPAEEVKALTVANDPGAGYLAPTEVTSEFIRELVQFSPIRPLATVRTTTAPSVIYPRRTAITNAKWKGETQTREESEPTFGQSEIAVRELTTYVDISDQLLADSAEVSTEVSAALSEDFGQKEGLAFVSGDGVLAPEGILTNADVPVITTGAAATLGTAPADMLISVLYSLPAAYRSKGTWLMNGATLASLRKLKDGQNNYLWQPSYVAGQPETILGRPVIEIPDMADIGAGTEPILFGDIATAYRIIDRLDLSILVDPYTQKVNGLTRIHARRRVGAGVLQPAAIRKIRCAA